MPGCYPTVSTLALVPAVSAGIVDPADIVVVAASGTSGAGKAAKPHLLGSEVMGSASAYGVGGTHRHTPEIVQNLSGLTDADVRVSFTPLLVPMPRGILATCSAPTDALTADEAYAVYEKAFADEPFVHLLPAGQWPQTKSVVGSNAVHVQVTVDEAAGPAGRGRRRRQPGQGHRRRRRAVHEPRARPARDRRAHHRGAGAVTEPQLRPHPARGRCSPWSGCGRARTCRAGPPPRPCSR